MSTSSRTRWLLLGVMVLVVLLYARTLSFGPVWDTKMFLQESVLLNSRQSLSQAFVTGYIYGQMGMSQQSFYYRPLVNLSFMLEKRLWGSSLMAMRLLNLLIFLFLLAVLFRFLQDQEKSARIALPALGFFALAPIHVDHIVWVVGRGDLLMALFGLLTLTCLSRYIREGRSGWISLALLFYALGQFSKETFLFFWPLLVFYEYTEKKRITPGFHFAGFLITGGFFMVKHLVLHFQSLQLLAAGDLLSYPRTGLAVLGYYTRVLAVPAAYAPFRFVHELLDWRFWLIGTAGLALFFGLWRLSVSRKQSRLPLMFIALFLLPPLLLSYSTMWPFRVSARYLILPLLGVAWLWGRVWVRWPIRIRTAVGVLVILLLAAQSWVFSSAYRSDLHYWERALRHHPSSSFVLLKAAAARNEGGDTWLARRYVEEALEQPMAKTTAIGLSILSARQLYQAARYDIAMRWLDRIPFALTPYERFHVDLLRAKIELARGETGGAESLLAGLIDRFPQRAEPAKLLHGLYLGIHRWNEAARIEESMSRRFPQISSGMSDSVSRGLPLMSVLERVRFYSQCLNYRRALQEILSVGAEDIPDPFIVLELHHRAGLEEEAEEWLNTWMAGAPPSAERMNRIALFYLNRMEREEEARRFFEYSLKLDPHQDGIRHMMRMLEGRTAGT